MPFTGNENHAISLTNASNFTRRYRQSNPLTIMGGFFGKDAIEEILNQPGCVGIRYYHAINDNHQRTIILVGVDANENDIVSGAVADYSIPCPVRCSVANSLNS